jgi:hypothetical protein
MEELVANSSTATDIENGEVVTAVQNLFVKINNLLQHRHQPEYYVDLMSDEVVNRFGRECIEKATEQMLQGLPKPIRGLSKKFTDLVETLDKRYFGGWLFSDTRVDVVCRVAIDNRNFNFSTGNSVIQIPLSSEAIMVERLLEEMVFVISPQSGHECEFDVSNQVYLEGAPVGVDPSMRHLSAEEFIAAATREPTTVEEHMKLLTSNPPQSEGAGQS